MGRVFTQPGSKPEVTRAGRHVRSTPRSRHRPANTACPFRAITGSEGHSITSWAPELNDHRDGWFGALGTNRVPAIRKSLELYEMRRQCRGDIRLALYRVYRVIFAAHNEGRTLDATKIREHVERLVQWSSSETYPKRVTFYAPHHTSRVPLAAYHRLS
jgi:hypothetical protein